jgi:hypothetical protein
MASGVIFKSSPEVFTLFLNVSYMTVGIYYIMGKVHKNKKFDRDFHLSLKGQ